MRKTLLFSTMIAVISFGCVLSYTLGAEPAPAPLGTHEIGRLLWIEVQNPRGDHLGRISDFVIDSNGQVVLAVILSGSLEAGNSKLVAVPFNSLSLDPSERYWVLNTTQEKLAAAPPFRSENLPKGKLTEDVYRYFGLEPSWGDEPQDRGTPTYNNPYDLMVEHR
jgi:hypothetical protein